MELIGRTPDVGLGGSSGSTRGVRSTEGDRHVGLPLSVWAVTASTGGCGSLRIVPDADADADADHVRPIVLEVVREQRQSWL
ncbi:hypothetical protein [Curtobacterium sp. RRHDQ10]|uniref:hypothetical protein n=1 Tax=Curtobacterium phyllosphaerae TaxID=3413379 RepID=UPI003BF1B64F